MSVSEYWKGRKRGKFSDEHRRKMSEAAKNRKRLKLKHSEKTIEKMSLARKKNPIKAWLGKKRPDESAKIGDKSKNWKGGICSDKKYLSWIKNKRNRMKRSNGGAHTFGEWETLKAQYNFTCPCCKESEPKIKLTEDHIVPISKGGSDNIENIQPLCGSCNSKKNATIIKY